MVEVPRANLLKKFQLSKVSINTNRALHLATSLLGRRKRRLLAQSTLKHRKLHVQITAINRQIICIWQAVGRPRPKITNRAALPWLKLTTTRWTHWEATTCYKRKQRREVEVWQTCRAEMAHSRFKWVHWPLTRRSSKVLPRLTSHQTTGKRIRLWWNRRLQVTWRLTRHLGWVHRVWP